ncbi:MAG: hypothetical protein HPM95_09085 [Alphaproteobacteria bacterium]|nr:hypothetical protein [Alphaproteobacteria bacterium]
MIHRYWGLSTATLRNGRTGPRQTAGFNTEIARLARLAPEILLLVENVGHYSLLPRDGRSFLAGPLDHFFPWGDRRVSRLRRGRRADECRALRRHRPCDAVVNLFNWRRAHPAATKDDPRFSAVLEEDLRRCERLHPFDFVDGEMPWLHVSDSLFYPVPAACPPEIPLDALITEGLEVGSGNLPWASLPQRLGQNAATHLVLEVEPGAGESHRDNRAQARSLAYLRSCFEAD